MSNNIRDIEEDIKGGRKTLVILLGREKAVVTLAVAFFVAYLWIAVIVLMGYISPWALVMFLGLRKPISAIQSFQKRCKGSRIYAYRHEINSDDKYDFRLLIISRITN